MPKGDLLDVLFAAFEETPYWSFKVNGVCLMRTQALADHTNQPHAWLREVLNEIGILSRV
jgi:hypothetical protein